MSQNFTLFVIARIVGGISKGNVGISTAIVADVCPPERRGKGMVSDCAYHLVSSFGVEVWVVLGVLHCMFLYLSTGRKTPFIHSFVHYNYLNTTFKKSKLFCSNLKTC